MTSEIVCIMCGKPVKEIKKIFKTNVKRIMFECESCGIEMELKAVRRSIK